MRKIISVIILTVIVFVGFSSFYIAKSIKTPHPSNSVILFTDVEVAENEILLYGFVGEHLKYLHDIQHEKVDNELYLTVYITFLKSEMAEVPKRYQKNEGDELSGSPIFVLEGDFGDVEQIYLKGKSKPIWSRNI